MVRRISDPSTGGNDHLDRGQGALREAQDILSRETLEEEAENPGSSLEGQSQLGTHMLVIGNIYACSCGHFSTKGKSYIEHLGQKS